MQSMHTAATSLDTNQRRLNNTANNLANVNTIGFKKSRLNMASLMHQKVRQPGVEVGNATLPSGLSIGTGVRVVSSQELHTQGGLKQTSGQFDIAISGEGFFQVQLPTGELAYTRAGDFQVDGVGNMVTPSGYLLEPQMTIPEDAMSITISEQGVVMAQFPQQVDLQEIGTIELARFVNKAGLDNRGNNVYLETTASGAPILSQPGLDGAGSTLQGQLETSNVNVAEEMVEMIEGQRSYEMASKVISTSSDMVRNLNDSLRG